jgi:hypothetical protein
VGALAVPYRSTVSVRRTAWLTPAAPTFEIVLGRGYRVRILDDFEADALTRLLASCPQRGPRAFLAYPVVVH